MGVLTQAVSDQRLRAACWDLFLEEGDGEANTSDAHLPLPLPQHTPRRGEKMSGIVALPSSSFSRQLINVFSFLVHFP